MAGLIGGGAKLDRHVVPHVVIGFLNLWGRLATVLQHCRLKQHFLHFDHLTRP